MAASDVTQTIECTNGSLSVSGTSASCSVDFQPVTGLISSAQTSDLIAAIAVCYLLKKVIDIVLSLMGFRS